MSLFSRPCKSPLITLSLLALGAAKADAQQPSAIDIPFERFVLDNGLTVIVHEDHKAPIVTVNIWYHVGSKNEQVGRTGFAHLFEHLMFNGSENYNDDYFKVLEPLGATNLNGTTNNDRTNYFQDVPTSGLDAVLWMESDRMGHLLGAIDQERLDEQRGVVQNEKRQGENQPYGRASRAISANTYPPNHPYSWSVIGSMDDLNAASLEDVHAWFESYYGAANAVVVIAGDIDVATARAKVERYFGDIPSGPPVVAQGTWVARMTGSHRMTMEDRVPQQRIYKVWNVPERGAEAATYLDLVTDVLAAGKNSRFYERLVYNEQIATSVSAYISYREIGSQVTIRADVKRGVDLAVVEQALDEELARFLAEGPTETEMRRIQTQYRARFIRGAERIGGFGGKSDILAQYEVYSGDPGFYRVILDRVAAATAADLQGAATEWLADGVFILEVNPFPEYDVIASDVDRSAGVPEPGDPPEVAFPTLHYATLSNGLEIILAERHDIPLVNLQLLVDAGYAADQFGVPGTASLAMAMLDEGTDSRSSLEINEELAMLGATLRAGSNLDMSTVSLSALTENLDASLDIFADVILNPAFPAADFDRVQQQRIATIQREKLSPVSMALRTFSGLLYGQDHAYGNPLTGSGTEESVAGMSRGDLIAFHDTWFRPNNATLIVVGATTMDEMRPRLERLFRSWDSRDVPHKNLDTVAQQDGQSVYMMDRPGASQTVIFAGHLAPPRNNPDEIAIQTMNGVLGGSFSARVNMNLREDKHWSYGARTLLFGARAQRPFLVYAPVQTDKTSESIQEIVNELTGIIGDDPARMDELERVQLSRTLTLPGSWETMNSVGSSIAEMVRYDLPTDYWDSYADAVRAVTLDEVNAAARSMLHPDKIVWLVVGDKAVIEDGIRALELGPMYEIDADGNVLTPDLIP